MNLKHRTKAMQMNDAVVQAKAVPWTPETLPGALPQCADSYDVLGKVHVEQGPFEDALANYRAAASITPGCILWLRHCGTATLRHAQCLQR